MRFALFLLALLLAIPARAATPLGNPVTAQQSAVPESSHVFATAPASIYGMSTTIGTTAGWLMVFNAATVPSSGSVTPSLCYQVPASTTVNVPMQWPIPFTTGITAAFSTTGCFTLTPANAYFEAQTR